MRGGAGAAAVAKNELFERLTSTGTVAGLHESGTHATAAPLGV